MHFLLPAHFVFSTFIFYDEFNIIQGLNPVRCIWHGRATGTVSKFSRRKWGNGAWVGELSGVFALWPHYYLYLPLCHFLQCTQIQEQMRMAISSHWGFVSFLFHLKIMSFHCIHDLLGEGFHCASSHPITHNAEWILKYLGLLSFSVHPYSKYSTSTTLGCYHHNNISHARMSSSNYSLYAIWRLVTLTYTSQSTSPKISCVNKMMPFVFCPFLKKETIWVTVFKY